MIRSLLKWVRGFCPHMTLIKKPVIVLDTKILGFSPPVWGLSILLASSLFLVSLQIPTFYGKYIGEKHLFQNANQTKYNYIYNLEFDADPFTMLACNYNLIYRLNFDLNSYSSSTDVSHTFYVNDQKLDKAGYLLGISRGGGGLGDSRIPIPRTYLVNGVNTARVHLKITFTGISSNPTSNAEIETGYLTISSVNTVFRILSWLILPVTYLWSLYRRDMNNYGAFTEIEAVKRAASSLGALKEPRRISKIVIKPFKAMSLPSLLFYLLFGGILAYSILSAPKYPFTGEYPYRLIPQKGTCNGTEEYVTGFTVNPITRYLTRYKIWDSSDFHVTQERASEEVRYTFACNGVEFWSETSDFDGFPPLFRRYWLDIPNDLIHDGYNEIRMQIIVDAEFPSDTDDLSRVFYYSNTGIGIDNTLISLGATLVLLLPTVTGLKMRKNPPSQ